ncbi:(2Fe-2S)-binding protein [Poritiphilus flavus]|uniref:2Fe-2S iron-sulfur cluster binding domain-containing protein n=1 Tax=Poritiphilus flavus TaxID=2697053 RepID=A0A6L9E6Z2_9FLAO|nr:(2Fe-2S)-binding protein [Poritiphilus flavus]NAS10525.1 2Fe-2S iron-sulfur cluster binding domain-containing protein [Poritiphilus flavus]
MPTYQLTINSNKVTVEADPDTPLLWILRDHLGLTGTKYSCGVGICGSCTVHYNGNAVRACSFPIANVEEGEILTIEGISEKNSTALRAAWKALDVPQCGYCHSGQIMSATALLAKNPKPSKAEINTAMSGNICRCGTYSRIQRAIELAANNLDG